MRKLVYLMMISLLLSCSSNLDKAEKAITDSGLSKHIAVLASDDFGGRKPCTENEKKTLKYIESQMKSIGLEPLFGDSYLQEVPLVEIKGKSYSQIKIKGKTKLNFNVLEDYSAMSKITRKDIDLKDLEMVFVGYGINAPELGWNDYAGVDVKDKVVVCLVNDPGFLTKNKEFFGGKSMTYYGRWTYKYEEAARQGAKAVFIIHRTDMAGYPWAVPRRKSEGSIFCIDDAVSLNSTCDVEGWFSRKSANKLFKSLGYNLENLWLEACKSGFKSFDMQVNLSMSMSKDTKHSKSYNIAGKITGKEKPEEALIYMGHWDHLGIKKDSKGIKIYNGASDNAAGVAWVLEIAKAFKEMPSPKRTIVFINPTVEEAGLLGSYYFVDHCPFKHENIICGINTDVLPFVGKFKDITITGYGQSNLDKYLSDEAKRVGRYVAADPTPENGMFFRSDHFPYMKKGIPCLFAKGMQEHVSKPKDWMAKYMDMYWKKIYHKPTDIFDPNTADVSGITEDARLIFRLGYKIANSDIRPKWNEKSEFARLRKE
ncbi:MAG: M28 family peptidase [Marinifilaceae bacterium]|jgi:Zn-dependent M28 family amino/carboxypeptidase|nr:M28 family peptidase [Marinifilaceae bacterium]